VRSNIDHHDGFCDSSRLYEACHDSILEEPIILKIENSFDRCVGKEEAVSDESGPAYIDIENFSHTYEMKCCLMYSVVSGINTCYNDNR